ncbi:MAG: hypothetical protein RL660_3066 [Bacteroidota bacterium]|jgi:hypothetical protein
MSLRKISLSCVALLVCLVMAQCKKKTTTTEVVDPNVASFQNMQLHIFKHSCNSSGCHNTAAASNVQHGLVLEGVDVYERLVNVAPKNADAKNANLRLVVPNSPDSSFLFTKCAWTSYKFGNQMPLGANALKANEIEFIKQWINAGAPKTGIVADYKLLEAH